TAFLVVAALTPCDGGRVVTPRFGGNSGPSGLNDEREIERDIGAVTGAPVGARNIEEAVGAIETIARGAVGTEETAIDDAPYMGFEGKEDEGLDVRCPPALGCTNLF